MRRERRRSRVDLTGPSLLGIPVLWLVVFFLVPIGFVAAYSVDALSIAPGTHPLTLEGGGPSSATTRSSASPT